MKTIEQIIRDDIGQGGPQLPSDEYEQRIDSILGQMNCAELLTRISNAVAEIGGASGMRLVFSGPVSALRSSTKEAPPARVFYTNYRGETSERTITPIRPWFGSTEWHPEPQWLLRAYDHDKGAERDFALKDFNTRPAPAATNTRLETIGYAQRGTIGLLMEGTVDAAVIVPKPGGDFETPVVMREKADELLAEKDVIIRSHLATIASFETKLAASEEARGALSDEIEQGN